jgi:hypothetical protein
MRSKEYPVAKKTKKQTSHNRYTIAMRIATHIALVFYFKEKQSVNFMIFSLQQMIKKSNKNQFITDSFAYLCKRQAVPGQIETEFIASGS